MNIVLKVLIICRQLTMLQLMLQCVIVAACTIIVPAAAANISACETQPQIVRLVAVFAFCQILFCYLGSSSLI